MKRDLTEKKPIPMTEMFAGVFTWLSLGGFVIASGFLANFVIYSSRISLNSALAIAAISTPVFLVTRWISKTPWVLVGFVMLGLMAVGFVAGPLVRFFMTFETESYLLLLIPGILSAIALAFVAHRVWNLGGKEEE